MRTDAAGDEYCDIEFIGPSIRVMRSPVLSGPLTLVGGELRPNGRAVLIGASADIATLAAVSVGLDFGSIDYHYTDAPDARH